MLRMLHQLKGFKLAASDDEFGRVKDFLFDEEHWTVRYMVADTGRWIPHRKVLVSPISLGKPDWDDHTFHVKLTKEEVKNQPELQPEAPVSRRHEQQWHEHYAYPYYYTAGSLFAWGFGALPVSLFAQQQDDAELGPPGEVDDLRFLRSVESARGMQVTAEDGEIGHVEDFVVEDDSWQFRYLVVKTSFTSPARSVLLAPNWFSTFDWDGQVMTCAFPRTQIGESPAFDANAPIDRPYEEALHTFYDMSGYWSVTGV